MPEAGLEPARPYKVPADFKSAASTNSATPALRNKYKLFQLVL